jgi:hypothetical protein
MVGLLEQGRKAQDRGYRATICEHRIIFPRCASGAGL